MNGEAIFFEFDNTEAAALAQDTLEELGYRTGVHTEFGKPALHIQVDHSEISSALEIAQAHGGRLIEQNHGVTEEETYAQAYNYDNSYISIPAHLVNEDWTEDYATDAVNDIDAATGRAGESDSGNGAEVFDPSGDDYNHFDAGVRL